MIAYHLFGHVRQRVSAWKDPMAVYQNEGYQIVQSLFAIGTGIGILLKGEEKHD